jgi:hypothetical protein
VKKTASGVGSIVQSTEEVVAGLEKSIGRNVAAAVAVPASKVEAVNAARASRVQEEALQRLTAAEEAYQNVLRQRGAQDLSMTSSTYDIYGLPDVNPFK